MKRKRFLLYHLPAVVFAAMIFAVSSLSTTPEFLPEVVGADKVLHTLEYFLFGCLLMRVFATSPRPSIRGRAVLLASMVGTAYALSDELHQSFVPGRTASLHDVSFDILGIFLAAAFYDPIRYRVRFVRELEDRMEREVLR